MELSQDTQEVILFMFVQSHLPVEHTAGI